MINDDIKELALANGFTLKQQPDGTMDLNPYVYQFARALLAEATGRTVCSISNLLQYIGDFGPDADPDVVSSEAWELKARMTGEYFMGCETQQDANVMARALLDGAAINASGPLSDKGDGEEHF